MQLKGQRAPWLWGIIALGVLLIVFGVQVLSEKLRQTRPITYLFDQPATVPVEASEDWLRGAVWIKPRLLSFPSESSATFSHDGQLIAVTMGFGVIGVLRAHDGSLARMLTGHRSWLLSVAFSPDGRFLASSEYKEIRLWSLSNWETVKTFPCNFCIKVVFSPDGRWLAAGDKTSIRIWGIDTAQERVIPTDQGSYIDSVEFSDDGQLIASSGGTDGTIKVWRVSDGTELLAIKEQTSNALEFSIGGSLLACVTPDGVIKLWRLPDGSLTQTIPAHREASVLFSPNGDLLASSSEGTIKLWSPKGQFLGQLNWQAGKALAFSPDGKYLVSGVVSGGATLKLWQIADRSLKLNLGGVYSRGEGIKSLAFSPDGTMLASSVGYYKGEGVVKLWRMPEGRLVRMLPTAGRALAFSPDGQLLAVAEPQTVTLWQLNDGKRVRSLSHRCDILQPASISSVAFSPDGALVAIACGYDGSMVGVWRVSDGSELFSVTGSRLSEGGVAFSPDGQLLAVAKGSVKLYSIRDGKEVGVLEERKYYPGCLLVGCAVAFSPNGQFVAVHDSDNSVKIWKVSDGQEVRSYTAGGIQAIAFVPDGKTLAIAERDIIKLWDVESDQWGVAFRGHSGSLKGWINALAVSPDGKYLASGGGDGLALWQIRDQ